jgi:hypothetical protein
VAYNRVYNSAQLNSACGGILLSTEIGNLAYDNLTYNNAGRGIQVAFGATNTQGFNNTIYGNTGDLGIRISPGDSNTTIQNNIIFGMRAARYQLTARRLERCLITITPMTHCSSTSQAVISICKPNLAPSMPESN